MARVLLLAVLGLGPGLLVACQTDSTIPPSCRTGVLTQEGSTCQAMRDDQGALFSFYADMNGYHLGDQVCVCGPVAKMSFCGHGTAIDVTYLGRTCPK